MNTQTAAEYRNLPLSALTESVSNPRRHFEEETLKELAESIRVQGVLSPLIVRPLSAQGFEIVAGARRYRAAQLAEIATVPVRVVHLTDAEALETQLVENLQRRDVHPMEEAQGFVALLTLSEPHYSTEQIAAKLGKTPAYIAQRIRLTYLTPAVIAAFLADEIGVGHALLIAKLQPDQQEKALGECFREDWTVMGKKPRRSLMPIRHLQHWIEHSLMLLLKLAPFDKQDATLVPAAGSCVECPKRTGHNKLLFAEVREDACTDPTCYNAKLEGHVQAEVAAKPQLIQISTAYGAQAEGSKTLPRNGYVEVSLEKPDTPEKAKWPEFKTCKHTTEAIVMHGVDKGALRKVCPVPTCPVHHPPKQANSAEARSKDEQDKRRKEEAIAAATGLQVLAAIAAAVPVRLMKRDLLFIVERLLSALDEQRLLIVAKGRGIRAKGDDVIGNLLVSYAKQADESSLGRLIVEAAILLSVRGANVGNALTTAAQTYKVDAASIGQKVRQAFANKEKTAKPSTKKPVAARQAKPRPKPKKAA